MAKLLTLHGQIINSTAYIYIYAGELLVCPLFGLSRVISLATSKVISLSTFWAAVFALKNSLKKDFVSNFGPN